MPRLLTLRMLAFGLGGLPAVPWAGWHSLAYGPASLVGVGALLVAVLGLAGVRNGGRRARR